MQLVDSTNMDNSHIDATQSNVKVSGYIIMFYCTGCMFSSVTVIRFSVRSENTSKFLLVGSPVSGSSFPVAAHYSHNIASKPSIDSDLAFI